MVKFRLLTVYVTAIALFGGGALHAATIGSFDSTRVLAKRVLNDGADRDVLRNVITSDGHIIAAATDQLDIGYLSGLDVFYTSALGFGSSSSVLSAAEQSVLVDWVRSGGILLSTGEVPFFQAAYKSVLNPFGIDLVGQSAATQGSWSNDPSVGLLQNGVAGQLLGDSGTGVLSSGTFTELATNGTSLVGLSKQFGNGLVIAIGDSNFLDDQFINTAGQQFVRNVLNTQTSAVPLPATLPLMLVVMGIGGLAIRRNRRP